MSSHSIYRVAPGAFQEEAILAYVTTHWPRETWPTGIIFLPNRRSVTLVRQAFLRLVGDQAALLPSLLPLADIDPYLVLLASQRSVALQDAPVMPPLRRRCLLAAQVKRFFDARKEPCNSRYAMLMADALAEFLDQCTRYEVKAEQFDDLVDKGFSVHWQRTLAFLSIVTTYWPEIEREQHSVSHAAYVHQGLKRLADAWRDGEVSIPVLAAGSTGSHPATAELLCVIAGLSHGALLLPGVPPLTVEEEKRILPGHPLYHVKQLAEQCGTALHALPLMGEEATDAGRFVAGAFAEDSPNVSVPDRHHMLACADEWEEARVISLIVRDVLETPGKTVMVVSPERAILKRVDALLTRWGIYADSSSADRLLDHAFIQWCLRLLEMIDSDADPLRVLAFFQHPLTFAGDTQSHDACVAAIDAGYARGVITLRGPLGLERALRALPQAQGISEALAQLFRCQRAGCSLSEWFAALDEAANACLASTAMDESIASLFAQIEAQGEGDKIDAQFCRLMIEYAADAPWFAPVRHPFHPRVMLHSPIEARMVHADTVIMAGLNEGSWPRLSDNPWVNRRMQEQLGMATPEHELSLQAHDFLLLASQGEVYLTRAIRCAQSLSTASRWWRRLVFAAMRRNEGFVTERSRQLLAWVGELDKVKAYIPAEAPMPNPPAASRPRHLRATEVEDLLFNPYAIYARHVLGLREPDAIDESPDNRLFGTLAHKVLEQLGSADAPDGLRIDQLIDDVLRRYSDAPNVSLLWRARLKRCVEFFLQAQVAEGDVASAKGEVAMELQLPMAEEVLFIKGRADRVEHLSNQEWRFIDYKSGKAPPKKQIMQGEAPQLLLYHMAGRSMDALRASTAHCAYWQLPNGADEGSVVTCELPGDVLAEIAARYSALAAYYLADAHPMPYAPHGLRRSYRFSELARAAEWGGAES